VVLPTENVVPFACGVSRENGADALIERLFDASVTEIPDSNRPPAV
jgi:hypothetical protein